MDFVGVIVPVVVIMHGWVWAALLQAYRLLTELIHRKVCLQLYRMGLLETETMDQDYSISLGAQVASGGVVGLPLSLCTVLFAFDVCPFVFVAPVLFADAFGCSLSLSVCLSVCLSASLSLSLMLPAPLAVTFPSSRILPQRVFTGSVNMSNASYGMMADMGSVVHRKRLVRKCGCA